MSRFLMWGAVPILWFQLASGFVSAAPESIANRFVFRSPQTVAYHLEETEWRTLTSSVGGRGEWLKAWPEDGSSNFVQFGSRVVLQLKSADDLQRLTAGRSLELSRTVAPSLFILQAPDALSAAREAHRLAALEEVLASYPLARVQVDRHSPYARPPNDSFFYAQWALEHRNSDGSSAGVDINARAAWAYTTGQGVTIAIADTGVELTHPELVTAVTGAPHFNFAANLPSGLPIDRSANGAHGTEVAGLAAAAMNNARIVGVAPGANLASWVVLNPDYTLATDEQLMDAFQYQLNLVGVQNHSWGSVGSGLAGPGLLTQIGISNAIFQGRSGRGVVIVRSGGNNRMTGGNVNDDGYPSDPHVVAVAAVRIDGRVAGYSSPGACLLVAAPGGDSNSACLFSTDLLGADGANRFFYGPPYQDLSGYVFDNTATGQQGFSGTSAAAAIISGIAALMLSANPELTYRDVQQILILSSRHFDIADPDLVTNGAGFLVSHNAGFGVPDAGVAVRLALTWPNRPAATTVSFTSTNVAAIPDDGLRLLISGDGVPGTLASIRSAPSLGPHADSPTRRVPLVDIGPGTNAVLPNLTNKAALILRTTNALDTFARKINYAAQAGAAFAVIYNYSTNYNPDPKTQPGDQVFAIGATDFVPIPAVFIGNSDGEALRSLIQTNPATLAQIYLQTTNYVFNVTNTMICEHVGLRVMSDHQSRSDVRITLVSPSGTRSVLQRYNFDPVPGPVDWTYFSTHHFFENTAGPWTAYFSDEMAGHTGAVQLASLILEGVPIHDRDRNGLDDYWEISFFNSIFSQSAKDDPDQDGYSNAREQVMGTDPVVPDDPLQVDFSFWNQNYARLSWPSTTYLNYEVWSGTNLNSFSRLATVPGRFPESEWFTPYKNPACQFFRIRAVSP